MNLRLFRCVSASSVALTLAVLAPNVAHSEAVTSLSGGTLVTMPILNVFGPGPQTVAPDITWSSTGGDAVFGYTDGYDFNDNGVWDYHQVMVGTNDATSSMTFTFSSAVSGFGGFLNYATGEGVATVAAYDANNTLIESSDLLFRTDGSVNSGQFQGFQESAAIIKSFSLTGAYVAGTGFQVAIAQPVPEPATWAMLVAGLGLIGCTLRRTRNAA